VTIWNAILLGLVQGIAEFLPISSSGHLSILQNLFHMSTAETGHLFFDVLLHLGTLISICIVYWRDIAAMVRETIAFFRSARLPAEQRRPPPPPPRAKARPRRLGLPFVAVPTIAATCAAWTPLSVWYNDAGQALHYEIFDDANFMVLLEPEIILNAPQEYLLAGIGDTLAKWYEAVVLAPQPETLPLTVRLGINNAQAIRDVLLNSSEQALSDQQNQQLTQSFCDVVDAIIAGGGMVGGLGDRFTRVAAAHAVHNGLTVLPQTEKFLHGTKVAYGILVQSALLGQDDVLAQLTGAYQRFHLPTTLAELEVDINNQVEIDKMIAHTLRPVESIHYLPVTLTPDTLRAAFEKVESFKA